MAQAAVCGSGSSQPNVNHTESDNVGLDDLLSRPQRPGQRISKIRELRAGPRSRARPRPPACGDRSHRRPGRPGDAPRGNPRVDQAKPGMTGLGAFRLSPVHHPAGSLAHCRGFSTHARRRRRAKPGRRLHHHPPGRLGRPDRIRRRRKRHPDGRGTYPGRAADGARSARTTAPFAVGYRRRPSPVRTRMCRSFSKSAFATIA